MCFTPTKLVVLSEGALQGFYDEHSRMDHVEACKKIAITLPGEESERLAEVAKKWKVYLVAQAKVVEPDIIKDRFFNTAFIIDPEGNIIHKHRKGRVFTPESTTTPCDVYDLWKERFGSGTGCLLSRGRYSHWTHWDHDLLRGLFL